MTNKMMNRKSEQEKRKSRPALKENVHIQLTIEDHNAPLSQPKDTDN